MKIAFIGIGKVGFAIANSLQKKGHKVLVASYNKDSESLRSSLEKNRAFQVMSPQEAIDQADAVFLTTPYQANEAALKGLRFNGKLLVDCTNPIGPGLSHSLRSERSGSEVVQELAPDAHVVKAFNIYGFENFANPSFPDYNVKPVMPIAGNDTGSKKTASDLIEELGFFPKDTGKLDQALHLEHMTLLWVKMVRLGGNPNFVWGYLER